MGFFIISSLLHPPYRALLRSPCRATFFCFPYASGQSDLNGEYDAAKYKHPKQPIHIRTSDVMKRMTLEEKVGQMVQLDKTAAALEIMKEYSIWSVLGDRRILR
ncbi:hypothetical protein Dimus_020118 [Dionaea muscipula]